MTFKIGIISDTHGLLRPEAKRHLADVDHIIHCGDIGRPEIRDALRRIAPVSAIRGNVDTGDWAGAYPETEVVRLAGRSIYVLHDLRTLKVDPIARAIDVVVSCHSHLPKIDTADGVFYLNPGSAGRRRFNLPVTLATIDVLPNGMRPLLHDLGDVGSVARWVSLKRRKGPMRRRRKDRSDPLSRRDNASFDYDRHDAGSEARASRAPFQTFPQSGLEAIDQDAGRAESGEFERRRGAEHKQGAQRKALEVEPDRRDVVAEISGMYFESGRPEGIE
jgi:uncharacterized protein